MKNIETIIKKITEKWFLTEPVLFPIYCTHSLVSNDKLSVPFRVGRRRIEYSPHILSKLNEKQIEECLKIEAIRILLKHPYQRKPYAANPVALSMASNVTINDACEISKEAQEFLHGLEFSFEDTLCFEEYYEKIKHLLPPITIVISNNPNGSSENENEEGNDESKGNGESQSDENGDSEGEGDQSSDGENKITQQAAQHSFETAALWEEDEEICCGINKIIQDAESGQQWGSLSGDLKELIKASCRIDMDYRRMLSHFRTSVLSSKRYLTRMKPSRRYGFDAMGSRYALASNLLIAVDVSGSVSDESLSNFFSVINRFFKYGIEKLDVIQFDAELKSDKPLPMKKARSEIKIIGRGGTDFQPAADFYCAHPEYDGLIYFTDGYAPMPIFNTKRPIDVLWVLCGRQEYNKHKDRIKEIKRNRVTYIPSVK